MKRRHILLVLALSFLPSATTWLYFCVLHGRFFTTVIYGFNKIFEIAFPLIWVGLLFKGSVRPARPSKKGVVAGLVSGTIIAAGMLIFYFGILRGTRFMDGVRDAVMFKIGEFGASDPLLLGLFMLYIVVANSFIEEFFWRWFVFGQLKKGMPVLAAAALSGFSFMFHHIVMIGKYLQPEYFWTVTLTLAFFIGLGGMIWALMQHRTGTFAAPWISHLIADIPIAIMAFDILRPAWN